MIDEMWYSLKNLNQRKLRSFLTVLSIVIGVMAIFAIVSFGLGLSNYVDTVAEDVGVDKVFVQARGVGAPGTDASFILDDGDLRVTQKVRGVAEATGIYMAPGAIKEGTVTKYNYLMGFDPEYTELVISAFNVDVVEGRHLKKGDLYKVILGYNYQIPDKIFKKAFTVGEKVEINGIKFDIIGFYNEIGNPSDDANIYITLDAFEALFPEKKNEFGFFMARAERTVDSQLVAERIEDRLRKHKGEEEGKETFYAQTFEDAIATFGTIITVLNGILFLIALVSMVVSTVNIMNTMYTAVLERKREIGIMKAVGATRGIIAFIFVFEAGVLGLVGGLGGILIGYLIASTGGQIAAAAGFAFLAPIFPWYLIIGCLAFSMATGMLAGILPALKAASQNPVDALKIDE